ncbi:hypothetical protein E4U32_000689 [Claviceps aff. humidiphila group G2b]|nr:hypothetical protein E4U32_000689 [Claviceps aff. humidiphila group G2b]
MYSIDNIWAAAAEHVAYQVQRSEARRLQQAHTALGQKKIRPILSFRHSMTSRTLPALSLRTCVAAYAAAAPNSVYSAMPRVVAIHEQPIFHISFATRDPQSGAVGTIAVGIMNDQGM